MKNLTLKKSALVILLLLAFASSSFAIDISILGAYYTQAQYASLSVNGTYKIELTKDNYSFRRGQFSINITLPSQGSYDPTRASEAIIPDDWQLTVTTNNSLILSPKVEYSGTGAPANRRKDFFLPVLISANATNQPTLVTVDWADPDEEEASTGNSAGSVLNVASGSSPLPVDLISFDVHKTELSANLNWATAKETNSDRFEVQHSLNGKEWKFIGSVASHGEGNVVRNYSFNHPGPADGINYYRLKMIDTDLKFAFSTIRDITFNITASIKLYPNPVSEELVIEMADWIKVNKIQIFNLAGTSVYNSGNFKNRQIDVRHLPAGIYLIDISKSNGSHAGIKFSVNR